MKSRWTTYLLLTVVIAVWGVVAWKILVPANNPVPDLHPEPASASAVRPADDTLRLDYPDPFLKGAPRPVTVCPAVRSLPAPKEALPRRKQVAITHLGTISSSRQPLYILTVGNEQYELTCGGAAGDFVFTSCDRDSLYLRKDGVTYGVKLCE